MSDTPRTDALIRFEFGSTDQPFPAHALLAMMQLSRQLERELSEAMAERDAAIARSMSNAMEAQAHEDRARMAEAECERFRTLWEGEKRDHELHRVRMARVVEAEAECERLRQALAEIREEWAGAECGEPVTAQESYAIQLCRRMFAIAADAAKK